MCLIVFAYKTVPDHRLVLAANRDEFFHRPTRRLDYWPEAPTLLAGQDLELGGTWLGLTRSGRFAAVTNVRQGFTHTTPPHGRELTSRGQLPLDFLLSQQAPLGYLQQLLQAEQQRQQFFAGYNLLVDDGERFCYSSNRNQQQPRELTPGVYALSNAALDTPWPKVADSAAALQRLIEHDHCSIEQLLQLMQDRSQPEPQRLPDTGVGMEWEQRLGSRFIDSADYGTRSTLVLMSRYDGNTQLCEQSYTPQWQAPKSFRLTLGV
ncbi:MAG: NRDE family protein [Motiliproteus sp.]